jgi:hypothetical protein
LTDSSLITVDEGSTPEMPRCRINHNGLCQHKRSISGLSGSTPSSKPHNKKTTDMPLCHCTKCIGIKSYRHRTLRNHLSADQQRLLQLQQQRRTDNDDKTDFERHLESCIAMTRESLQNNLPVQNLSTQLSGNHQADEVVAVLGANGNEDEQENRNSMWLGVWKSCTIRRADFFYQLSQIRAQTLATIGMTILPSQVVIRRCEFIHYLL